MADFKQANANDSSIVLVDTTDTSNDTLVQKYNVTGFPTIVRVSDGAVYKGARDAASIQAFASNGASMNTGMASSSYNNSY